MYTETRTAISVITWSAVPADLCCQALYRYRTWPAARGSSCCQETDGLFYRSNVITPQDNYTWLLTTPTPPQGRAPVPYIITSFIVRQYRSLELAHWLHFTSELLLETRFGGV